MAKSKKANGGGKPAAPKSSAPAGTVTIRLAETEDDIAAMIELGRKLHAESGYRNLPLDDDRMWEIGRRGLKDRNPGLFIAEHDDGEGDAASGDGKGGKQVVGMAIAVLGEYYFSPARSVTVQLLYVLPEARGGWAAVKLLRALRQWAQQNQAQDIHVNVTTGIDTARTDRFLRRMGFKQTGGNYVLEGVKQ